MNRHAASRRLARTPVAAFSFALALVALASVTSADDTLAGRSGAEANDGLVVIAHPDLAMSSIDGEGIRRLFLGKSRKLPNGARAELASYGPASSFFNERVLAMSDVRVATIWSRLRFSGRTPPPEVFDSVDEVVEFVAATPNAIAYVPTNAPRDGVRVFYGVPR